MSLIRYQSPELSAWTPYERLSTLRDEMNRLFEGTVSRSGRDSGLFGGWTPPLDVHQDRDNIFVTVELPGLKKEEIEITIHDGTLSVAGERKSEAGSKEGESVQERALLRTVPKKRCASGSGGLRQSDGSLQGRDLVGDAAESRRSKTEANRGERLVTRQIQHRRTTL